MATRTMSPLEKRRTLEEALFGHGFTHRPGSQHRGGHVTLPHPTRKSALSKVWNKMRGKSAKSAKPLQQRHPILHRSMDVHRNGLRLMGGTEFHLIATPHSWHKDENGKHRVHYAIHARTPDGDHHRLKGFSRKGKPVGKNGSLVHKGQLKHVVKELRRGGHNHLERLAGHPIAKTDDTMDDDWDND